MLTQKLKTNILEWVTFMDISRYNHGSGTLGSIDVYVWWPIFGVIRGLVGKSKKAAHLDFMSILQVLIEWWRLFQNYWHKFKQLLNGSTPERHQSIPVSVSPEPVNQSHNNARCAVFYVTSVRVVADNAQKPSDTISTQTEVPAVKYWSLWHESWDHWTDDHKSKLNSKLNDMTTEVNGVLSVSPGNGVFRQNAYH